MDEKRSAGNSGSLPFPTAKAVLVACSGSCGSPTGRSVPRTRRGERASGENRSLQSEAREQSPLCFHVPEPVSRAMLPFPSFPSSSDALFSIICGVVCSFIAEFHWFSEGAQSAVRLWAWWIDRRVFHVLFDGLSDVISKICELEKSW